MNNVDLIVLVGIEVAHPSTTFVGCAKKKTRKEDIYQFLTDK